MIYIEGDYSSREVIACRLGQSTYGTEIRAALVLVSRYFVASRLVVLALSLALSLPIM